VAVQLAGVGHGAARYSANKVSAVEVKAGDSYEQRELTVLGSQIKQEIADRLKDNLLALGKLKKSGRKVGALKCKRFVNSIPLKQYGVTYNLDFAGTGLGFRSWEVPCAGSASDTC